MFTGTVHGGSTPWPSPQTPVSIMRWSPEDVQSEIEAPMIQVGADVGT